MTECMYVTERVAPAKHSMELKSTMITSLCSIPHEDGSAHPSCRLWAPLFFQLPGQLLSVCGASLPPPLILFEILCPLELVLAITKLIL